MNLPNLISLGRLLSVPVVVWLLLKEWYLPAFLVFVAAGVSDAIDGVLARRLNARSVLGSYLDPLADKALLVSVYVLLGVNELLPAWIVILVVFRDALLLGGTILWRLLVVARLEVAPLLISKVNTAAQIVLAGWVLAAEAFPLFNGGVTVALIVVVAATTLASGAAYLWHGLGGSERSVEKSEP